MKPLNLSAKLRSSRQDAKLLSTTTDGKFIFQLAEGALRITDAFGFDGGKQIIFDTPRTTTSRSFQSGDDVWYLRFSKNSAPLVHCRFLGMADKAGVCYITSLDPNVALGGREGGNRRALASMLYKDKEDALDHVTRVYDAVRATCSTRERTPTVVTRKNGEGRRV